MKDQVIFRPTENIYASKPRYEVFDGFRGVAAYAVVFFHLSSKFSPHGFLAVDFFYILSGYVISYAYDEKWDRMSLSHFYKRRLIRLHPMIVFGHILGIFGIFLHANMGIDELFQPTLASKISIWKFFLSFFLGFFLLPTPSIINPFKNNMMFPFNSIWTLFYEYIGNILYSLIFRFCKTLILGILCVLSALLTINYALNINAFNLLEIRKKYTMNGGNHFDFSSFIIGFTRLFYPLLIGMFLRRLGWKIKIPFAFWIGSIILIIIFFLPALNTPVIGRGIYELICVLLIFPIIILIGAGSSSLDDSNIVCKFLGDISYPLFASHYPTLLILKDLAQKEKNKKMFNYVISIIGMIILVTFIAYSIVTLLEIPIRKWLSNKFLKRGETMKKKNSKENDLSENITNNKSHNINSLNTNYDNNDDNDEKDKLLK